MSSNPNDTTQTSRIAWVHSHFLCWTGGAKFVHEVSRRLNKSIPVDILVERCSPEIREMYRSQGIEVIEINNSSSPSIIYWILFPYYLIKNILALRNMRRKYTTFIASIFPMNFAVLAAGIKKYVAYVLEPFAFFYDRHMIAGFPFLKRVCLSLLAFFYSRLDIFGVNNAAKVLTINETTARWVNAIYGCQSTPSFLGVDTEYFSPRFNHLREKYAGRKTVIHSTDFTPLKRTWDAVNAIEHVRTKIPEVKLLITCTIEDKNEIEELTKYIKTNSLEDHIEILGHLSEEDLVYYYSLADVSLYVGIGRGASAASLFVLECMACGTPGVRTNFTHDEIEHGVSGFLYRPGDDEALNRYLIELLSNDPLRERFGHAARQRVVEQYQWDSVAQCFLDTIHKLV